MNLIKKFFERGPKRERIDIASRFELGNRLGQGSMSRCWKAHDTKLDMPVALKVLDSVRMQRFEARFIGLDKPSEGEIASTLVHPNIIRTYDFGWTSNDEHFLVMEYVTGVSLSLLVELQNATMKKNRLSYMIQIGAGLSHFHQRNWIHRDLCPRNVLITDDNVIKLIDFGLAVPNTSDFQKPGNRTGTAAYMAPELIKRQRTDQRIDIFSYAVTCYEMYTKRHPWEASLTIEAVMQHLNKPPTHIKELVPDLDDEISETIMKGLANDPDDRWRTAAEMTHAFRVSEKRLRAEYRRTKKSKQSRNVTEKSDTSKDNDAARSKPQAGSPGPPRAPDADDHNPSPDVEDV